MTENQQRLLSHAQDCARACFEAKGELLPMIMFTKGGKVGLGAVPVMANNQDKDRVAEILKMLRKDCEAVSFAVESWIGHDIRIKPSQDINRKEAILIWFFCLGEPTQIWSAEIKRNPTSLGPWELWDAKGITGRFV